MISAFGVEHTISKAWTPNKEAAYLKVAAKHKDRLMPVGNARDEYLSQRKYLSNSGKNNEGIQSMVRRKKFVRTALDRSTKEPKRFPSKRVLP